MESLSHLPDIDYMPLQASCENSPFISEYVIIIIENMILFLLFDEIDHITLGHQFPTHTAAETNIRLARHTSISTDTNRCMPNAKPMSASSHS